MRASSVPPVAVRQGGKEELRASMLKTYLLRLKSEKGDEAVRAVVQSAGVDPEVLDNETGWISTTAARRILRALAKAHGFDFLRERGDWAVHPEALGAYVRMLRQAKTPRDAYEYLAANAREVTRVGTFTVEGADVAADTEPGGAATPAANANGGGEKANGGAAPGAGNNASAPATAKSSDDGGQQSITLLYAPVSEEDAEKPDADAEALFCAARIGELRALPRIWGLPEAVVKHPVCLAKGGATCTYEIRFGGVEQQSMKPIMGVVAALVCAGAVAAAGGVVPGIIAGVLGGAMGTFGGHMLEKTKRESAARTFEKHRIAALERGLDLRGDTSAPTPMPGELVGTVLGGKYRITRKIGSGGIGVVYLAEHTTLGHEVAVKVLRGAAARDGGEIARLRREAHIQAELEHPNIARVMDLDQMPDGSMYVVMERLIGRSLADKLARETAIAPGYAIPLFVGVCRALAVAHQKGVVHRDLKPGNIFLCEDGTPKVLDFGMSKLTAAESLTQAGYTLGTPEYMAPEQCIGANVEPRTDVYALGVVMYEALTGDLPINSSNRRELLDLHQRQVPTAMRVKRPDLDLPQELDDIVMRCLKKKLAERPKSATEVEMALAAIPLDGLAMSYPRGVARRAPASTPPPPVKGAVTP